MTFQNLNDVYLSDFSTLTNLSIISYSCNMENIPLKIENEKMGFLTLESTTDIKYLISM